MSTPKYSEWFSVKSGRHPVNPGRYECEMLDGSRRMVEWDKYWDAPQWNVVYWRGLMRYCSCGGNMALGQAIAQTYAGMADFAGDAHPVTVSAGGKGKLVDCAKCERCGFSVSL